MQKANIEKLIVCATIALLGCDVPHGKGAQEVTYKNSTSAVEAALRNQVFVEGGTFMLGDVGSAEGVPYTPSTDNNKPPIEVTLDSFSISRYETTWGDFMVYLEDVGRKEAYKAAYSTALEIKTDDDPLSPNYSKKPARSPNFQEARGYCEWLAEETGKPFALPTEAQWEYAARNGGKNVPYATNTGKIENDTYLQRPREYIDPRVPPSGNVLIHSSTIRERRPVGSYPPSPIGLFDMTGNVSEWTNDWYEEDYYEYAEDLNPKGPKRPPNSDRAERVVRDWAGRGELWGGGGTVFTRSGAPENSSANGFRCVVNSAKPLR